MGTYTGNTPCMTIVGILAFLDSSRYVILFLACFFEGTIAILTGGAMLSLGLVSFWPLYAVLLAADVGSDICWYLLGRLGTRAFLDRWGKLFGADQTRLERVESRFQRYDTRIIFFSKLTMGFGLAIATLVATGTLRVPFRRFMLANTAGALIWVLLLITAGYYWGNIIALLPPYAGILATAGAATVLFVLVRYSRRLLPAGWLHG